MPVCARPALEGTTAPPRGWLPRSASVTLGSIVNSMPTSQHLYKVNGRKSLTMLYTCSTQRIPHHMRQMKKKPKSQI